MKNNFKMPNELIALVNREKNVKTDFAEFTLNKCILKISYLLEENGS